jgi:geranylgeranyl diphosphate synthase type I
VAKKLQGDAKQYGLSTAILAGDLALSFAEQILTEAPFPQERLRRARSFFDQMKIQVLYGEYLDVLSGYKKEISEDAALQILDLKTARYTVERPLHIGATLAGADIKTLEVLTAYAIPLGQAFQLQDDILGVFGDPKVTGKSSDSDLKEGKMTVLLANALSLASLRQKQILSKAIGNPNSKSSDITKVKQIIINTKALDITKEEIDRLILKAKKALINVKLENNSKDFLLGIADFIGNRLH